ncbi:MAG: AMP-binding protein [Rhodospirillaceae bacterium]|jgi:2-furoate---CoA ligase|nr:AMP-binding protein [Rhodospirillaceae bacterium]MBT7954041.1 AMP-binding protein [Rhodospirillaceae bacterium]
MQTCYDLVWLSAQRAPGDLALVDDQSDRALTYQQLIEEVDIVAAGLQTRGVKQGMRIATVLPSLFDHAIALLALQRLAAIPALMNFRLQPDEIAELIKNGEIEGAIILSDDALADTIAATLPSTDCLISVGGASGPAEDFADCRGDATSLPTIPKPDREDITFIFYTSGTTGLPKGVELSHRTTEHRILWLATQAGFRHGNHNNALGFMPLSHAIGFYGVFLAALGYGGTYYVQSAFNPVEAVEMIEQHGITYMFAVPQLYFAMTQAPNYSPDKMKSLQTVLYGGAEIMPDLLIKIDQEWPAKIFHIYGTTEIMCPFSNPDPVGEHTRLRPAFYANLRVIKIGGGVDDIVEAGDEGELIVDASSDLVFSGYLNQPDATAETISDGWYHTGDVCLVRGDGDYNLIGRTGDMVRSGGENIHPSEVEPHLVAYPNVTETAIIGIKDAAWGELVVACVVAADTDAAALDAHMRETPLTSYKRPKAYLFMDLLPRNAANKVLRRELRALAEDARQGNGDLTFEEV